jgi:cytochrome c biogenesis protein CcmG/thiol:disulfide interchange protein DsbE
MRSLHLAFLAVVVGVASPFASGCGDAGGGGGAESASGQQHDLIGKPAPSFSVETANGKGKVAIDSLKGKVVFVDFWATWCGPCKESFPKLQELYTKYQASGLEIVGVSEDDDNQGIAEFGQAHGSASFPLGWDKAKAIAGKYNPPTMPTTFVVDKNGIVRFVHVGYHDNDQAELEKELKKLL